MQDIPVVLLNYNRPEFSKLLVENLAKIKPKKVYISIDGHKSNVVGDKNKVDQVETAFANIQWDCEVKLRRNEINLGLRPAVKGALDWFFAEQPFGIVLEDDIAFNEHFFQYCQRFSNLEEGSKIGAISGNNLMAHMFSKYFTVGVGLPGVIDGKIMMTTLSMTITFFKTLFPNILIMTRR